MEIDLIMNLINQYGFPITVCLVLGFFVYKMYNNQMVMNSDRESKLNEQIIKQTELIMQLQHDTSQHLNDFSASLDSFNKTLTRIDTRLETVERAIIS